MRFRSVVLLVLAALLGLPSAGSAQTKVNVGRESTVGMRSLLEEVVIMGSELETAETTFESPVVVRIIATRAHGSGFRYDIEWTGLEAGSFDLRDYLRRKDGSELGDVPDLTVEVAAVLPAGETEPSEPDPVRPADTGGYSTQMIVFGVLWVVGLLAILFVGRKRKAAVVAAEAPPTFADRLRPFVEAAANGKASPAEQAELERLLVAFWRERLDLEGEKADRAIRKIREHDQGGPLLRELEAWLHMPEPPQAVDVQKLLAPYRQVDAAAFDRAMTQARADAPAAATTAGSSQGASS